MAVPKKLQELRSIAGLPVKKEVWRSLGAADLRQIKCSLTKIKALLIEGFENEMNRLTEYIARPAPTDEQLQREISRFSMEMRESLRQGRIGLPTVMEIEGAIEGRHLATIEQANVGRLDTRANALAVLVKQLEFDLVIGARGAMETRRAILRDELYRHLADNNFVLVGWAIDEIVERGGYRIDQKSHTFKRLGHELIAAWILELDGADTNFMELAKPNASATATIQAPGGISSNDDSAAWPRGRPASSTRDIRELFETYMAEQKADIAMSGRAERYRTIAQFVEVCGLRDVADYRKADMAAFKSALKRLPINAARDNPGLSTLEIIEQAGPKAKTLKPKTINLRLSIISVFGKWLADTVDGVEAENFSTAPLKITDTSDKMEEFTDHQVCQILLSPAFTGCESERNQSCPGTYRVRNYRFWLPLLAAYTGCRLNELTQLRLEDVVQRDGVWAFQITDQGDEQSLKTKSSKRLVPIHSHVIDLGFLQRVEKARELGHEVLFHDIPKDRNDRRSEAAGKRFRKYIARLGIKGEGERGGLHRFRHTVIEKLRKSGLLNHEIALIVGHDTNLAKMTAGYGSSLQMLPKHRQELIERIFYDGLDLALLK